MSTRLLLCGMRQHDRVDEVVEVAAASSHLGVVGVDLAGPEAGFPASRHAAALERARQAGLHVTVHAGEGDGPASIADALDQGAQRLGHGVRIIEDVHDGELGQFARRVQAQGVTLEVCPSSNVHTGVADSLADHPIDRLRELGFRVTLNPDNRLMSGVSAGSEMLAVAGALRWGLSDLEEVTNNAVAAAFLDEDERGELSERVDRGFAAIRA